MSSMTIIIIILAVYDMHQIIAIHMIYTRVMMICFYTTCDIMFGGLWMMTHVIPFQKE